MLNHKGTLMTSQSPSGDLLYGDKTEQEKQNEQKEYKKNILNESVKGEN